VLASVALATLLALAGGATRAAHAGGSQSPVAVPGELIVGFEDGASKSVQNAAVAQAGATKEAGFPQIDAALVQVPAGQLAEAKKRLLGHPRVRYVEPNHVVRTMATPNDPSFNQLWGLHNTGQTGGTPDADIDAPEAWDLTTGSSSVVVGVTDTGVDFSHPDLAAQQWVNTGENCGSSDPGVVCAQRTNAADDDGNGYVDDWRGWDFVNNDNNPFDDNDHGTHVSGTIGGVGNNGTGVAGVNWNVKIMALKFLSAGGSGTTADAIAATLYAANEGAHVSSNSWGGGPFDQGLLDAIEYGASKGMLFVAAAGNDANDNDSFATYPASYESDAIVAVAATDHTDDMAFFSSYGANTVDLGAPGVNILSTIPGGAYDSFSGTSMATPHVAGVAALLKARYPDASLYGLKALLLRSVDPVESLAGKTATGGRLNAFTAASCDDAPKLWLGQPAPGFVATVGDTLAITVLASNCASPAGVANVSVTVNGSPVTVTAASPDRGLYRVNYSVPAQGPLTVTAQLTVGEETVTQSVSGTATLNYVCADVPLSWVDVTPGTRLTGASGDDSFSTLGIGFPVSYFGQTYSTAYVSSNGFLALGSNSGAAEFENWPIPAPFAPNGIVAPFWDDLDPSSGGAVYAAVTGAAPNRTLHVEWFQVPHFNFGPSGTVTFELSLSENGDVRFQYLDTDFADARWNNGVSATAGLERADGNVGKQVSHEQPLLTSGRAVSCSYGAAPPPPPPPVPTITTTTLPGGTVGQAYSQTLAATGGTPPYAWSLDSGSLPPGLTLNGSTGAITGTPTSAGTASFTARVTDDLEQSDTQSLTIAVAPPPAPTITTSSLPGGEVGVSYSATLAASGGTQPYAWSVDSGSLPDGLALDPGTGAIAGVPTTAGSFSFTARVTDDLDQTDTAELTVVVAPPPTVATTSLPGANVGSAYGATLQATGGTTPYSWSLDPGPLPPGLALDSSTGAITGTPTSAGTFTFTVRVTDAVAQFDTQPLSITVAGSTQVTASPDGTTILAGSHRAGTASSLAADDNAYYQVNSTTSGTKTTDWYGRFDGVTNSLSNLRVNYTGKNSRSCTQVIFIWRWTTSSWAQLNSRSVGTSEVAISNLVPSGAAADYVSGTSGDGEVRVRVRCRRSGNSFFTSGDLMRIGYERPAGFATAIGPRFRGSFG
jgi:subtilisin family serine protease